MCEIKYHVKLPIFIARQWIRHRTANVNEYSARYSILDKEFYIPSKDQLSAQSKSNRQGRGDLITGEQANEVLKILKDDATRTYDNYEKMLNERFDGTTIDENKSGHKRACKNEFNIKFLHSMVLENGFIKSIKFYS